MSQDSQTTPSPDNTLAPTAAVPSRLSALSRVMLLLTLLFAIAALAASAFVWYTAQQLQVQVARQVADLNASAKEGAALAKVASTQGQEAQLRLGLLQGKVAELDAQREQVNALMTKLTKAQDENLLVDLDSAVQAGLQYSQITGSVQPMLAALLTADKRLKNSTAPHLANVQLAIEKDIDTIRQANVSNIPGLTQQLDGMIKTVDTWPLQSQISTATLPASAASHVQPLQTSNADDTSWWARLLHQLQNIGGSLVRVRTIENRDAALLAPEQGFYARENIRLRLLNARMALLARQPDIARSDLAEVEAGLNQYFQTDNEQVAAALSQLNDIKTNIHSMDLPSIAATTEALSRAKAVAAVATDVASTKVAVATAAASAAASTPAASAASEASAAR